MDYLRKPTGSSTPAQTKEGEISLFRRRLIDTDLDTGTTEKNRTLAKTKLVNILNFRHFKNANIQIHFHHVESRRKLVFEAIPQPCFGKYLICLWRDASAPPSDPENYRLTGFAFSRGVEFIHAEAGVRALSAKGICLVLPEKAKITSSRLSVRHECHSIHARLLQNGVIFAGSLKDFNASAFCVTLSSSEDASPVQFLNTAGTLTLMLESEKGTLYSGECRISKSSESTHGKVLVLEPLKSTVQRFAPREYRSRRISISPAPDIVFIHPLTGTLININAVDISGAGVSAEEFRENSVMVAGMIIPDMTINFSNAFSFRCQAQVAYTRSLTPEQGKEIIKSGIAFLDMDPNDHVRLMSLIHHAENTHSYICNRVDIDTLWEFFFETGFIYPKKYAFIQPYKEEVKKTYEKLYTCQSAVARHFTWQQNGAIFAHLAMLRFYENTWLIHHLAAKTGKRPASGTDMVDQISSFAYDTHRLASSQMSYLICYYRPTNHFPAHFFGGAAEHINNPDACSVDEFSYHHTRLGSADKKLERGWTLSQSEYDDLCELNNFYDRHSGGQMINALDLVAEKPVRTRSNLADRYHEMGLWRERRVFALRWKNEAKAIIMANISDFALNLSDLTNCISVFVIDRKIPYDTLHKAISMLGEYYASAKTPVLVYPLSYAEKAGLSYDRVYCLWAMNMQYTDDFFKVYHSLKQ